VLKACLAQFVRLDACGEPATGAASKLTTKGFIQVIAKAQIETGQEFLQKNACGEFDINETDDDLFKRYDLEMHFSKIDPEGLTLVSSARGLTDGADTKGFAVGDANQSDRFSLELWTKVAGQACSLTGDPLWYYFAFPNVGGGRITDVTFEDAPLTMTVTGKTRGAGATWGRGPSLVLAADDMAQTTDHLLGFLTDVQPPEPVCGLQAF
jgi:hypothetical protein